MKRLSLLGFVGVIAGVLAGCPIWDNNHGDATSGGCTSDNCTSGNPPPGCSGPADCQSNETCGDDGQCHPGDCSLWGCVPPLKCLQNPDQTVSCQPGGAGGGGTGGSGTTATSTGSTGGSSTTSTSTSTGTGTSTSTTTSSSGTGGASPIYCGNPKDCQASETCSTDTTCHPGTCDLMGNGCISGYSCGANGQCSRTDPAACALDSECSQLGQGYECVGGKCTKPSDQCFDKTQCAGVDKCANGKCTPSCAADADCPANSGYKCDTTLGICTVPVKTCTITNDCGGPSTVCVAGACIPRSNGTMCPAGQDWVDNGCIPTQGAQFVCTTEGMQDACALGSLCLHHSCYIACDPVQTPNACTNLPTTNQCKPVTSGMATYNVCGSNGNLGSDCGASNPGKLCGAGQVCIDGFCK
jgi:hypothetical protein